MKVFKLIALMICLALVLGNPMLARSGAIDRSVTANTAVTSRLAIFEFFSRDT